MTEGVRGIVLGSQLHGKGWQWVDGDLSDIGPGFSSVMAFRDFGQTELVN
ncbi:unnamed protein product [Tetraodon nigroviridis]|uniref:Chromosome 17 SCAF14597, whole genome shotgun sequence n=1 Tax=Tetraodon nigroviridis TaxID=99883 RepID=Q4SGD8_TETNG|nr:unnamed protein product [Tetraodon nigroviridis]